MARRTGRHPGIHALALAGALLGAPAAASVTIVIDIPPPPGLPAPCAPAPAGTPDWSWSFAEPAISVARGSATEIRAVVANHSCAVGTMTRSEGFYFDHLPDGALFEFTGSLLSPGPVIPSPVGGPPIGPIPIGIVAIAAGDTAEIALGTLTIADDFVEDGFEIDGDRIWLRGPDISRWSPPGGFLPTLSTGADFASATNSLAVTVALVPAPGTLGLALLGVAGATCWRRAAG